MHHYSGSLCSQIFMHATTCSYIYQSYKKLKFTTHTNTNMLLHMDSKKPDTYINESDSPYSVLGSLRNKCNYQMLRLLFFDFLVS